MKTQISRDSHRPERRYSGVYQQQGRMITDADWNELMELVKRRLDDALTDVVASGAPRAEGVELAKAGSGQPLSIKRGQVYAGGVLARVVGLDPAAQTFGYDQQADFLSPPALPSAAHQLYADVWERAVISLEDAGLRDPALHGADTATRTQTMAQVKWCAAAADPEDPTQNPPHGDASLTLTLRKKKEGKDPCDPCADEVGVGARTGNYLFRVEVHDVEGPVSTPDRLVLKWSSENGAEQHVTPKPPGEPPPDFATGDWIYEFYSPSSESHLGVHLTPGFAPIRGQLEEDWPAALPSLPWVRRWDGYCILKRTANTWSLEGGRDRGVDLSETTAVDADGHVDLGDELEVKLEAVILTLGLKERIFVAGDHWLAPVREAVHTTGDNLLAARLPLGINHNYVRLARVNADEELEPFPTADFRRLNFPPLTDLRAGDVGYDPDCPSNLFDPTAHDTVEKALNQICQIAAQHIAYQASCPSGLFDGTHDTVKKALDQVCQIAAQHIAYQASCPSGLFDGTHDTVKKALDRVCAITAEHVAFAKPCDTSLYKGVPDTNLKSVADALALLCDVQATQVSYDAHPACTELAGATTVQEALDNLCLRPSGGGCKVTVGPGGHFRSLAEAVQVLLGEKRRNLCLCLLPGDHKLPDTLTVDEKEIHITIAGCGPGTRLLLDRRPLSFSDLASVTLGNFAIDTGESGGLSVRGCRQVELIGLEHVGSVTESKPLLRIERADRVRLIGNRFEARMEDSLRLPQHILGQIVGPLFKDFDRARFSREVDAMGVIVAGTPLRLRQILSQNVRQEARRANELTHPELRVYLEFSRAVALEQAVASRLADLLRTIRARTLGARSAAVFIHDASAHTTVQDCEILGRLQIYGTRPGEDLSDADLKVLAATMKQGGKVRFEPADTALQIRGSRLSSVTVGQEMLTELRRIIRDKGGTLGGVFSSEHLSDNTLSFARNHLVSGYLNLSANIFYLGGGEPPGWAVTVSSAYVGNQTSGEGIFTNMSHGSVEAANIFALEGIP